MVKFGTTPAEVEWGGPWKRTGSEAGFAASAGAKG
jgi:hypothetical protein